MWAGITLLETNLGISFEILITIMLFFSNFVFLALDWKKGAITMAVIYSAVFIWFYSWGMNYTVPLVMVFLSIVIMAFTIYFSSKVYNNQVI